MNLLQQVVCIVKVEIGFFIRFPKLILATVFVSLIPAFYAVIYLSSVWDPSARTGALPVGLVNQDAGLIYKGQAFNMGSDVISKLKSGQLFGFRNIDNEEQARAWVRNGKLAFALIIPHDFSANAVPGEDSGLGKLVIYTSEGNNFESASLARQFALTLTKDVNDSLNEQRWSMVLNTAVGSQDNLSRLREGVVQLRTGAKELTQGADKTATSATALTAGAARLDDSVEQMVGGVKQLGTSLKTINSRLPPNTELAQLQTGAQALATGNAELEQGLTELKAGSQKLKEGVNNFSNDAKDSLFVPGRIAEGLEQVAEGVQQLDSAILSARDSQSKLTEGAQRLSNGVGSLTHGVRSVGGAINTMVSRLPEDNQLEQVAAGAVKLTASSAALAEASQKIKLGTQKLDLGIETLAATLPVSMQMLDGTAKGLAHSVQPVMEVNAPVANHGSGFAPNILPGALWLGAAIAAFLILVRILPEQAKDFSSPVQLAGKIVVPSVIVLIQAALVFITVVFVLNIKVVTPYAFALTIAISSLTFLMIVFALTRAFGDAGKAFAMIFLALQVSASGGILPIELSGSLFEVISPWLPITWVVRAIKASMFGAFEGDWLMPLLLVWAAGLVAALAAATIGRWRYVKPETIRPALDF
jgi:putative membrane protein